jgi:hypothetical protein
MAIRGHPSRSPWAHLEPLRIAEEDEIVENKSEETKGFNGEGFAAYIAPYALALVASIAITAVFFKFVLLDY